MIKLVITSDSAPQVTRRFDQPSIVIGGEHALHADLKLSGQSLLDRHIQIVQQINEGKSSFFVANLANDPFVTLNNLPFGKQPIYGNDLIQVGDISIRFDYEADANQDDHSTTEEIFPQEIDELSVEETRPIDNLETIELKKQKAPHPSMKLDAPLLRSFPLEGTYPFTQAVGNEKTTPASSSSPSAQTPKMSLKDYYLSEYDDDEESAGSPRESAKNFLSPQFAKSWRIFLTFFAGLLGVVAVFASLIYLWVSDQTGEEETKAARGVADIAMSLTYAQLKHIHPQNQNWAYPEFIKNNLTSILAPNYISLADIDSHGQFANCPYMLRIYTSNDLSQFLVIAQPAPSLLQWLIPKASIIVDSRVMEMRKIKDLKALNRLIVNSNNLDGVNANEISNLVKQGELIPLSSLVSKAENQGLTPPKALGLIRPGAQNLVYNAPRYYLLGETILNTSLDLVDNLGGMKEVGLLQQELSSLLKFPDLVLYSSDGIQHALSAQKALAAIIPKEKFLIAYLQLNAHGKITNTHLLMDDTQSDVALTEKIKPPFKDYSNEPTALPDASFDQDLTLFKNTENPIEEPITKLKNAKEVDTEDPLFLQLAAVANFRQSSLKPITEEMTDLLRKHSMTAQLDFPIRFAKLQQKYADADHEQQTKIFKKFHAITHENAYLPASKFLEFVEAADLKILFQEYLLTLKQSSEEHQVTDDQMDQQFKLIQESTTWQELEHNVNQTSQLLQFERLADEARLVAYQNTTRSLVTQKLNQFILSSTEALPSDAFAPDYLQILTNILKAVWITDPDTHDFYIAEFELREPN